MSKLLTKQLLLSSNYWVLNKTLVKLLGLEPAFLLASLAEAETMLQDKEGWFYQTSDKVEEITTLSRHKQDQCIKQLEDMGILKKDVRGMPAKRYFRIDYDRLTNLIVKNSQPSLRNIDKPVCKKLTTNKEHIYKEPIYKEGGLKKVPKILTKNDIDLVISEWNNLNLQNLRSINSNTQRHKMLKARISEYSLDEVIKAIRLINDSSFLKGKNDRNWTVTFDWMVRPNNFPKILEGNYTDRRVKDARSAEGNANKPRENEKVDWAGRAGVKSF